nr:hypothetical protein [Tanacetum cinerariifolium]
MSSLFADTHNVVAILEKSDVAEGFKQIIDFLSGSYIHYALTVNPHIYISCIKQFWNTASVKRSDDVTRMKALVDKKKIVISEVVIHKILKLDDAEGVVCLPNEEIFAGLAQMGYEKPSTKLTFYKAFFSSHWKRVENLEHDNAAQKLEIIKLKARVKRLEKANQVKSSKLRRLKKDDADIAETEGRHAAEQAEKQAEIYHRDLDHSSKVLSMQEDDSEVQEVVEVVTTAKLITDVVTAASQVSATSATISAAKPSISTATPTVVAAYTRRRKGVIIRDPEEELSLKTPAETPKVKDKGKCILVEAPKPMKKKDQIELDAEYARKSKNPQYIKRYQGMKKRPQTESEARKNMMIYLKNTAGYKMDFLKGMTYAEICPIFQARFDENMRFLFKSREEMEEEDQEIIKSINETPAQKAAKRRKLSKEAQEAKDLRKRLEVVDDEDDDVFIEAT